ncbi:citrate carrier protein, CCS family [Peptoclostridium litorale DSM 5388]|uniref:Citrate-sodium symporter CitP n=1 Tax=Peptoclostridium litorale DSM 5388 TaxID=1121324 RepID=A0A069RCD7_PEPLI|nr:2-hydroxycarboxylate transporter family protein [Peptoclostridium litorale]KDR94443.1 citrate-sodium symporter CitP [Peptoclostridium litorale DSM 5388]SIO23813.1 citrate carrier protein, CCS family [Peptoclostridium litorale DSM 5388]
MSVNVSLSEKDAAQKAFEKPEYRIMGMPLPLFAALALVVIAATYLGVLPKGMVGAIPLMMVVGAVLNEVGNKTPIVKDYFGGGPIVVIFASAAFAAYGVFPQASSEIMTNFMKGEGFLNFYIAALITGSILGMNRKLLIKAAVRYLPAIIGGVVAALGLAGIVGALIGYGAKKAILYIALPIMGGGMGAGAVPLAQIFGGSLGVDPADMLSVMVPAVALGNAMAIVVAGILDKIGKNNKKLSGDGKLMKSQEAEMGSQEKRRDLDFKMMGTGLALSTAFFVLGCLLGKFIPLHQFALMILSVAAVKAFGVLPREFEEGAAQWFGFIMANLTPALLVGIGVAYTDINQVINSLNVQYVVLVGVTILGATIGSGFVGSFFGFYPIESSITAGLCMANMGGTGDVAVLSASKRMELMPFAQISSRIGGAFMLILATALLKIFT